MANFETELHKLMGSLSPQGGFGIQNLGAFQDLLRRDSAQGLRAAQGGDMFRLNRAGLGRSVGGAFSGGTRQSQFTQNLMDALTQLQGRHSTLAESQRQSLMGLLAPQAQARANRPSFLSTLLGGLGGLAGQAFLPGLANKVIGDPLMDLFKPFSEKATSGNQAMGQALQSAINRGSFRGI